MDLFSRNAETCRIRIAGDIAQVSKSFDQSIEWIQDDNLLDFMCAVFQDLTCSFEKTLLQKLIECYRIEVERYNDNGSNRDEVLKSYYNYFNFLLSKIELWLNEKSWSKDAPPAASPLFVLLQGVWLWECLKELKKLTRQDPIFELISEMFKNLKDGSLLKSDDVSLKSIPAPPEDWLDEFWTWDEKFKEYESSAEQTLGFEVPKMVGEEEKKFIVGFVKYFPETLTKAFDSELISSFFKSSVKLPTGSRGGDHQPFGNALVSESLYLLAATLQRHQEFLSAVSNAKVVLGGGHGDSMEE